MWLRRHWFLVSLALLLLVGFVGADELQPVAQSRVLRDGIVLAVMFCTGLTLPLAAIQRAISRPLPVMLAVVINIVGVPLLAISLGGILAPQWLSGLVVASLMPCTLASAAVWTRKAGGDDSIALLTTVITNLACWLVIPAGLASAVSMATWFPPASGLELRRDTGAIGFFDQMFKLGLLVVLPLLLAQIVRWQGGDRWATRHKNTLSLIAQIGVLLMVLFGAVASAQQSSGLIQLDIQFILSCLALIATASMVHLIALGLGIVLTQSAHRDRSVQIAVGISASQKTLMIGLQVAIDCGVSVLPMIVYHVSQLMWDTIIATRWYATNQRSDASSND